MTGWRRFFKRREWDRERREEIESYEQMEIDDNIARGMSAADARAAARRKLGNRTLIREEIYRMNTIAFFDMLGRDARHGLRMLRRNPGFTAAAMLTVTIGIGANIGVFSVVNSVLLRPLAYPEPDRLVALRQAAPGAEGLASVADGLLLSESMYVTYAENNRAFQALGIWTTQAMTITGIARPEEVRGVFVSGRTLATLQTPPVCGRWLNAADTKPGAPLTVMLLYGYWQRRLGGECSAVGRTLMVDAKPREIVGVMPRGFRFPGADADLIAPMLLDREKLILAGFGYHGVARLKPGVTIAQADADMARMVPVWMNSWTNGPGSNPHVYERWRITPDLRPLKADVTGNVGNVLWPLMGAIGIVMLIACANVANLLLVRAEARQQELAVRAALGAGWGRIVHELLVESALLGILGGALGLGIAYVGLRLLIAAGPANLPRLAEISVDGRALGFGAVISLVSGLVFGSIPALRYAGAPISMTLRGGGRGASQSRERQRTRSLLTVAQVALAVVLLVSAGLMIRTFQALRAVEPGFTHADEIQTMRISIPTALVPDAERAARMENGILDKLAGIPGVSSAAFSSELPMEGLGSDWDAIIAGDRPQNGDGFPPLRMYLAISPGLFRTMGTRFLAGRDFTWTDIYARRPVAIVSGNLAREYWGSPAAAIGKRVSNWKLTPEWREVIGVVEDVRQNGADQPAPATVFWPYFKDSLYAKGTSVERSVTFAIASRRAGTESFLDQVRQAVWSVNANLPVASVRTLGGIYSQSMARTSFALVMLAIAGAMALALGLIGIYGLLAYTVSQRRREIGIRLALGAEPRKVGRMFVRYALMLAGAGVAIGLAAAIGVTGLLRSLLFGVSPLDAPAFAAAPVVLAFAAALASYLPARRAAAVDPSEALRME